jgi:hypothetical protein
MVLSSLQLYAEAGLLSYELPYALGDPAIVLDRRVDRGALMKLCCHFGTALKWDNTIGSVHVLADDIVSKQCLRI